MPLTGNVHLAPASADVGETELVRRAADGDTRAFEAIMRRHNRLLFRTARSILRNDDDAEDALQEAYLRAWRAIGGFRVEAKVSTWLVRIVVNEALARVRRNRTKIAALGSRDDRDEQGEAEVAATADREPQCEAMRGELRVLLEQHIDGLPAIFRTVFMLRAVEELTVEETAAALQISQATVRTRFFRARSFLRDGLSEDVDFATADAFAFAGARCDRIVANVLAALAGDRDSSRRRARGLLLGAAATRSTEPF